MEGVEARLEKTGFKKNQKSGHLSADVLLLEDQRILKVMERDSMAIVLCCDVSIDYWELSSSWW